MGAALAFWYMELKNREINSLNDSMVMFEPKFQNEEIEKIIFNQKNKFLDFKKYENEDELISIVASQLSDGKSIGWFQGRMEFGPRALGSRSILS